MAWFKIDDGFWAHPKTVGLSGPAVALWLRGGTWSASQLTDGFIPAKILPLLQAETSHAAELVEADLWEVLPDGWGFHDWQKYQPTREQVEAKRDSISAKRAEAGRKGAESRWKNGKNGKAMANAWQDDGKRMAPSRPVPSRPDPDINHLGLSGHLPVRAREDDDQFQSLIDGIGLDVAAIQRTVHETLGVEIGPRFVWALWEKFSSDAKAPIRKPTAYLRKAITDTPGNAEKALFEAGWAA